MAHAIPSWPEIILSIADIVRYPDRKGKKKGAPLSKERLRLQVTLHEQTISKWITARS